MIQEPFDRTFQFEDDELNEYWTGSIELWDLLSPTNQLFLSLKWKNDYDALGQIYCSRYSQKTLHKMYAGDIRDLTQDILEENLDDNAS